jgi:hypothetical protein
VKVFDKDNYDLEIFFAHTSFPWKNLAKFNAGVIVVIIGLRKKSGKQCFIYTEDHQDNNGLSVRRADSINAYLAPARNVIVSARSTPLSDLHQIYTGGIARDNNYFTISDTQRDLLLAAAPTLSKHIKPAFGGAEFIRGTQRQVLYFPTGYQLSHEEQIAVSEILNNIRVYRLESTRAETQSAAETPQYFSEDRHRETRKIFVPQVFSENREFITAGYLNESDLILGPSMQLYDADSFEFSLISSKMHIVWVSTVCGKLKNDFRYSNTLGWNTFPVPTLTEQNKSDLTRCAEDILLEREAYFPATIADLYALEKMPDSLRQAHDRNDEVLERIYIGRRFKNDTERLEMLFDLYTKMIAQEKTKAGSGKSGKKKAS